MNLDEMIKEVLDSKARKLDVSVERCDDIIRYIETQGDIKKNKLINKFSNCFITIVERIKFKNIIEFAVVIFIFFALPSIITSIKDNGDKSILGENTNVSAYKYDFADELEGLIEHRIDVFDVFSMQDSVKKTKTEVYESMDEIKEKAPFSVEIPNYIPEGYKLSRNIMEIRYNYLFKSHSVALFYENKSNKRQLNILESIDIGRTNALTADFEKIKINNMDVWISEITPLKPYPQIIFWQNDTCFRVYSDALSNDELIKIVSSFNFTKADKKAKETLKYIDDIDEIKNNVPFKMEYPKYIPEGFKQFRPMLTIKTVDKDSLYILDLHYARGDEDLMKITQVNETTRPLDILNKSKKISLDGIDAWIYETKGIKKNIVQIMFWKDGKFFNVSGLKENEQELVKVAKSFLQ